MSVLLPENTLANDVLAIEAIGSQVQLSEMLVKGHDGCHVSTTTMKLSVHRVTLQAFRSGHAIQRDSRVPSALNSKNKTQLSHKTCQFALTHSGKES